jgi:hypothetical protein
MRTHPAVPPYHDEVRALVEELLRTGLMFSDVLSGLLDDMPDDAFPDESPAEALIEMLTGSVRPVAEAAGAETVRAALALVGAMADRTVGDLRRALEIARARRC